MYLTIYMYIVEKYVITHIKCYSSQLCVQSATMEELVCDQMSVDVLLDGLEELVTQVSS